MRRPEPSPKLDFRALCYLFLVLLALGMLLAFCSVEPTKLYAQTNEAIVRVRDFGRGMTPVLPPFRNEPEAIVFSQNMYSTQEGGRQVRFGVSRIDTGSAPTDSKVVSLVFFTPTVDSGSVVHASGRMWWGNAAGLPRGGAIYGPSFNWDDYLNKAVRIRPNPSGDSVAYGGDSVRGVNTYFTRDIQVGDSINIDTMTRVVKYIRNDNKLYVTSSWTGTGAKATYLLTRTFPAGYVPFLRQSGNLLYTGTAASDPQVIFRQNDALKIRHLGIVDSFYIDSIYTWYPACSTGGCWTNEDSLAKYGYRRSWDTTAWGTRYFKEFELVSRRKPGQWLTDQWIEGLSENPEAYYVRIGYDDKTAFYTIAGNSDTSINLMTWYVDSLAVDTTGASWDDSLYFGKAQEFQSDMPTAATVEGKWGYIYCAAGLSEVAVADNETGTVKIRGRGAMFWTIDASPPIDSTAFYKALHFIHLTGNDISFNAYSDSSSKLLSTKTKVTDLDYSQPDSSGEGKVVTSRSVWTCGGGAPYYSTYDEAVDRCPPDNWGRYGPEEKLEWTILVYRTDQITKEAQAIGNSYFPVRYMSKKGDTLFFFTSVGTDLTDKSDVQTVNWEIVKVGMPQWSGMAEWNTPPQLVAWGDTSAGSLISFSGINDPWNWSANADVLVGDRPSDQIICVVGYDDQLVIFKPNSIVGYDGTTFRELSQTDGLVGQRAVVGLSKELYWQDVDGFKKMQRRDFSGYSIQKISTDIDPCVNSWSSIQFGSDVVPFLQSTKYRANTVLTYNQRDNHLYAFGTFSGDTAQKVNNACLTYSLDRNVWDGYFTIGASDALYTTIRDTARIIIGSTSTAAIYALGYTYNDYGNKINGDLKSAKFFVTDEKGTPYVSKFLWARLVTKSASGALDSGYVMMIGSTATDTLDLTGYGAAASFKDSTYYSYADNISTYWQWEIKTYGASSGNIFQPQELVMAFLPITRDDE